MTRPARLILLAVPLFAVAVLGCGKGNANAPAKLSGTVTFKGAKLPAGTIAIHTKEGTYNAVIGADGTYSAADLPAGPAKITVETESTNKDRKVPSYGAKDAKVNEPTVNQGKATPASGGAHKGGGGMSSSPAPPSGSGGTAGTYVKIPEKYNKPETSLLETNLERGDNKYDIVLTD